MIRLNGKKASHVGIVLSFVIFVTFLIFIYTIIEPTTRVERGKQKTLELLTPALMNYLNEDMTSVTVNLNKSLQGGVSKACITLPVVSGIRNIGSVAKNENNEFLPSTLRDDDTTDVEWESSKDGNILKIFYSKEFKSNEINSTDCEALAKNITFDYGLIRTTEYIFESKIKKTLEDINDSREYYDELKGNLSIPLGDEFGFGFKDNEGDIIQTEEREAATNIYVEEIPIQYVDDKANINSGFIIIKVW